MNLRPIANRLSQQIIKMMKSMRTIDSCGNAQRKTTQGGIEAIELVPRIAQFARQRGLTPAVFDALANILSGEAEPEATVRALFLG